MKKIFALILTAASFGLVTASAEAKAASTISNASAVASSATASPVAAQYQRDERGRRGRGRSRVRVVTQTRLVRVGRRVYRETYQVRYLPNGRTQTSLISRVRVR